MSIEKRLLEKQQQPKWLKATEKSHSPKRAEANVQQSLLFLRAREKICKCKVKIDFFLAQLSWLRQRKFIPPLQVVFQAVVVSHHHALDPPVAPCAFLLFSWREIQTDEPKRLDG